MGNNIETNIKADLHMHTTASDGTWTPKKLITNLINAQIQVFAVTDHDSTANLDEVEILARENSLYFIPGVEINTTYQNHNYHILGLGIDRTNTALQTLIKSNNELLQNKDFSIIESLEKKTPLVTRDEFKNYVHNPERGGWKTLNYLIDKGICANFREFLKLFEEDGNAFDTAVFPSPAEAVRTISNAGGYAILAHPGAGFYNPDYKGMIKDLMAAGIMGIECFHPENSEEITEYSLNICRENNLLITGGSDCHGDFVPTRRLGHPNVLLSDLRLGSLYTVNNDK